MNAFRFTLRALAVLALVTGTIDVLLGLAAQATIGAALEEGYGDPLLNSQVRYLGAIWFGFGWLLTYCLRDLPRYAPIVRGALWVVVLGGFGRLASVLQFGHPPSAVGFHFVNGAIAIELVGIPLLLVWMGRLLPRGR